MDGKWGRFAWRMEHGTDLIHPDDLENFKKEAHNCKVFECIEEGEYLTLRYGNKHYRVKNKLFAPVPSPKFNFGEKVILKGKNIEAIITDIMWHINNREHYYYVTIGKKKHSKRFFESELSKVDQNENLQQYT
ncbi:hypothetical protein [Flavonifractor sp. An306]|uniref:DUF6960 family protein n=1 Tax=Flavonifractor sp. An306 TaxID=1965629 RepID=UPI00111D8AA1|nr:hypothetical protein [Flavonifractor sp. An306]